MSLVKITDLPPAVALTGTELLEAVQGANSVKVAASSLSGLTVGANPTASVGLAAVNGSAATFMRSDAAPPLSQAITPTWTALHNFTGGIQRSGLDIGYLDVPQNKQNTNYQFALTDRGKHVYHDDGNPYNYTVPANATTPFSIGTAITVINNGVGVITVVAAGGVTLRQAGAGGSGNRAMAQYGEATLVKVDTNVWFINGVGLT